MKNNPDKKDPHVISSRAPDPVGPYPHAMRAGNLLFITSFGPRKRKKKSIPGVSVSERGEVTDYDFAAQARSAFENIGYILEDAGSSWEKAVDVTAFLTNLKDDYSTFNQIYAEFVPSPGPARTTVEVSRLPTDIAIELKVIATV